MAKRISTDAKIVLSNAGYEVEYIYKRGRVIALHVWEKPFNFVCQLTVEGGCVDNGPVEELLTKAKNNG